MLKINSTKRPSNQKSAGIAYIIPVLLVILINTSLAETNIPAGSIEKNVKNKVMKIDDKVYSYNLDGINSYMNNIQNSKPDTYNLLKDDFNKMNNNYITGRNIAICGSVVGISIAALGIAFPLGGGSTLTDDMMESNASYYNIFLGAAGVVIIFSSIMIGLNMMPNEKDYNNFVDKHNNASKENPIKLDLSYNPVNKTYIGSLAFRF
jgi:hypothetical protein